MYFYGILCFGSHHQDTATEPRRWLSPQDASLLSLLSLMESMFSMLQLLCAVDLVLEEVEDRVLQNDDRRTAPCRAASASLGVP
jgi:hypothetical protein